MLKISLLLSKKPVVIIILILANLVLFTAKNPELNLLFASFTSIVISLVLRTKYPDINVEKRIKIQNYLTNKVIKAKLGFSQESSFLLDTKETLEFEKKIKYFTSNGIPIEDALKRINVRIKDPLLFFISNELHSGRFSSKDMELLLNIWSENLRYLLESNRALSEFKSRATILNYILAISFGFITSTIKNLGSLSFELSKFSFFGINYIPGIELVIFMFFLSIFITFSSYFNLNNKAIKGVFSALLYFSSYGASSFIFNLLRTS